VGDRTSPTSATVNLLVAEPRIMGDAAVHRTPVASTSGNLLIAGITGEGRFGSKTVFASMSTNLSADAPTKDEITDAEPKSEVTEVGYAVAELKIAGFKRVEKTGADSHALDVQIAQAGSQASEREEKALQPLAADKAYARKQPLAHKIAQRQQLQPQQTASFSAAAPEPKSKQSTLKPLLPQRASQSWKKKSSAQAEANEKLMPKLASTPDTKNSRVTPGWTPMGLAPTDKPAISSSQSQQKGSRAGSYNAKFWSARARKDGYPWGVSAMKLSFFEACLHVNLGST
jgi:hypothetical protein